MFFFVLVLCMVMFVGLVVSTLWALDEFGFFERFLFLGSSCLLTIGILPFLFVFPRRVSKFLLTFQILEKVDGIMKDMGIEISYQIVYYGSLWCFVNQLTAFISALFHHFQERPWKMQVGGHLAFGIAARILLHSINYCVVIYYAIYQRFFLLNQYLETLHTFNHSERYVKQQLCLVANLHQKLCKSANFFMESLDLSYFLLYLANLLFVELTIFFAVGIIYKSGFSVEVSVYACLFTGSTFMIIFAMEMVKNVAEETKHVLVEFIVYRSKTSIQIAVIYRNLTFTVLKLIIFRKKTFCCSFYIRRLTTLCVDCYNVHLANFLK